MGRPPAPIKMVTPLCHWLKLVPLQTRAKNLTFIRVCLCVLTIELPQLRDDPEKALSAVMGLPLAEISFAAQCCREHRFATASL
jgi:hypothetical protein